ncbi:DUF2333 family protein [Pseudahrensia aquimaris]|uniref:DUF2333 family protein n=1 Tax=Pseudahrensia aquimaris TaxID=744461 RepID=A0ABW3FD73_9HYPH
MLDPVVRFFERIFDAIGRFIGYIVAAILWPFVALTTWVRKRGFIIKGVFSLIIIGIVASYGYMIYQTQFWRGFNPDYATTYAFDQRTTKPGQPTPGAEGQCGPSAIVEMAADLTDFNVNQNGWVPSMLPYKLGFFGIDWKYTPYFDNKAAFQLGVHEMVRRSNFEAKERLGRVRGTSQIDQNLQNAHQNSNYNENYWYFELSPFGPKTPTPSEYRSSINNLKAFNTRLASCDALFDPRADNLLRFLDQMANALGSTSDILGDQMEASNAGWFDLRADDRFWFTYGQLYALNGIMAAARADFGDVIEERNLTAVWNKMQAELRSTLEIDPLIVSNGSESAFMMPSHLATMGFYLLRVRTNMAEMRDILDR